MTEHIAHSQELRLIVLDDATVGRDADLAIRKGVEGIDGLVARYARSQMHLDLHVGSSQILHLAGLDLSLFHCLHDGILNALRSLREGNLSDDERLLVYLLNFRPHFDGASTLPVVILADVDATRCGEIGEELEGLFVEVGDGCITNLTEIMGQDLRGEAHSNTFCTLGQYQWELHR